MRGAGSELSGAARRSTALVAPVTREGSIERSVYLPPGDWFHVWTGSAHPGGAAVTVAAPIGSPPVLSRDTDRSDLRAIP
jgi:sulfoquinovosidase